MVSDSVSRAVRGAFWLGLGSLAVSVLGVVFGLLLRGVLVLVLWLGFLILVLGSMF
jgi:hypothetical protein